MSLSGVDLAVSGRGEGGSMGDFFSFFVLGIGICACLASSLGEDDDDDLLAALHTDVSDSVSWFPSGVVLMDEDEDEFDEDFFARFT